MEQKIKSVTRITRSDSNSLLVILVTDFISVSIVFYRLSYSSFFVFTYSVLILDLSAYFSNICVFNFTM